MEYWIIAGIIGAVIVGILSYSYGRCSPTPDVVNQISEAARLQSVKVYEERIIALTKESQENKRLLALSDARYNTIIRKLEDIKKGKANVQKPTTEQDRLDRLNALGLTPVGK